MAAYFAKSVLGLALIRGELRARVLRGKETIASWDAPGPIAGLEGLKETLEQVPEQTGFRGTSVVVTIASSEMEHQLLKLPPMRERDMEAFLSRKVRHLALEGGRRAWSWHVLHGGRTEHQVALHLLPLPLMHVFLDFCRSRNYQIDQVLPLASALGWSARDLPLRPGEWGLLAAEMGTATSMVIADTEGRLALVRELSFGLADVDGADRLSKELNRSILFAKQQFRITVAGVWVSGMSIQDATPALAASISDSPVSPLPTPDPSAFWLHPLTDLDPDIHDNMVPRPMRRLNERRRHLETAFFLVAGVNALLLATILGLRILGDRTISGVQGIHLQERMLSLRQEKAELQGRLREIQDLESQIAGIAKGSWDAKPGWFLGWMGEHIPDPLRVDIATLERPEDSSTWQVRLQGTGPRDAVASSRSLRRLQASLQRGAPRLSITRSWEEQWQTNLQSGATWDLDSLGKPFLIEGVLR